MKAFAQTLMIVGLVAGGSNALAGNWPPKGTELETACLTFTNAMWAKQFKRTEPGQPAISLINETNAVLKIALSYNDDEINKVNENVPALAAGDSSGRDELEYVVYSHCAVEPSAKDSRLLRKFLLDPNSVTESTASK
jgi:hypothetical protein